MAEIKTFPFEKEKFDQIKSYHYGLNWPVVYLQEDGREMYIGQTTGLYERSRQHYVRPEHAKFDRLHVITDEDFNMSSAYEFESLLIQYISADGKFTLQNGNGGLINHEYFDRERYLAKLDMVWVQLQEKGLVLNELAEIKNTDFFKYSPFKALTPDQLLVAEALEDAVETKAQKTFVVNGGPGTGKSILALYLLKRFVDKNKGNDFNAALVISMTSLRTTLQRVLKRVPGMGADMVIGPNDVVKKRYDLLIVDEAHRLRRRVNLGATYGPYDKVNQKLGLQKNATQLDWILNASTQQILFYDERQNVMPGDVHANDFGNLHAAHFQLTSQMRVEGGEGYLQFIDDLLALKHVSEFRSGKYDFKLYDDIGLMVQDIKIRNASYKLSRVLAGYAWPWKSKKDGAEYDIEINGTKLVWNSEPADWVNSPNSINEVGCIHTIQGYDLNYAGIIIGPELSYDKINNELIADIDKYEDTNGKRSISDPAELKQYILNIYKTLLTRGIKGTYIYVVDDALREKFIELTSSGVVWSRPILSPLTREMIQIPLVGSAPCGNPMLGQENIEEYVLVEKSKIKSGFKYFILRAEGDSMNLAGINDGDLVLCRQQLKADTGDRVIALLGDNVTIKMYDKKDGHRILLPKSTNKTHTPINPEEGDSVQGIVQEVLEEK